MFPGNNISTKQNTSGRAEPQLRTPRGYIIVPVLPELLGVSPLVCVCLSSQQIYLKFVALRPTVAEPDTNVSELCDTIILQILQLYCVNLKDAQSANINISKTSAKELNRLVTSG